MKYFYQVNENTVYCVAKFAGKGVVGIAKCNTNYDKFDVEKGKALAKLRCDVKIANKRCKNAKIRWDEAHKMLEAAVDFAKVKAANYEKCKLLAQEAAVALKELEEELAGN